MKFEVTGESHGEPEVGMSFAGLFDLLPELVRLPSGSGTTITITEDYESDLLPSGISLKSAQSKDVHNRRTAVRRSPNLFRDSIHCRRRATSDHRRGRLFVFPRQVTP